MSNFDDKVKLSREALVEFIQRLPDEMAVTMVHKEWEPRVISVAALDDPVDVSNDRLTRVEITLERFGHLGGLF